MPPAPQHPLLSHLARPRDTGPIVECWIKAHHSPFIYAFIHQRLSASAARSTDIAANQVTKACSRPRVSESFPRCSRFSTLSCSLAFFVIAAPSNGGLRLPTPVHAVVACTIHRLRRPCRHQQGTDSTSRWWKDGRSARGMPCLVVSVVVRKMLPLTVPVSFSTGFWSNQGRAPPCFTPAVPSPPAMSTPSSWSFVFSTSDERRRRRRSALTT